MEKAIDELREIKRDNKRVIEAIISENDELSKRCNIQEDEIKKLEQEKSDLFKLNEHLNNENRIAYNKLKIKEDQLYTNSYHFDDTSREYNELEQKVKELEFINNNLLKEIKYLNTVNQTTIENQIKKEKDVSENDNQIQDKHYEIKKLETELNNARLTRDKLYEDNIKLFNMTDKLKLQIVKLNDQNDAMRSNIERLQIDNENIKNHFNQRDQLNSLNKSNLNLLKEKGNNVDDYLTESH